MTLPYHWTPMGAVDRPQPQPGALLPFEHRVWRVVAAEARRDDDGSDLWHVRLRPVDADDSADPVEAARTEVGLVSGATFRWATYPDGHYPVCAECREPLPCRERMAKRVSAYEANRLDRHSHPGICPECLEPITQRQQSVTFPNVIVPGGAPVTFHLRRRCRASAQYYEERAVRLDPGWTRQLTCTGAVTTHGNGTYECTAGAACVGPAAYHRTYMICACCPNVRGCVPEKDAERVG